MPNLTALLRLAAIVLLAFAAQGCTGGKGEPLTVFAAASLQESMDEAAAAYRQATGTEVRMSYAASSTLARQIEQGAPAQVFLSADDAWMDYLQERDRIDPDTRVELLGNSLVLVAPRGGQAASVDPARPGSVAEALGGGRLAIAHTSTVPAGKYGRQALESLGHWPALQEHLAESDSVRAALMLVARGEAPLGVVYASDARVEPRVQVVASFPDGSHPPIVYPVAAVAGAGTPARDFVRWLDGQQARAIFARHGFKPRD